MLRCIIAIEDMFLIVMCVSVCCLWLFVWFNFGILECVSVCVCVCVCPYARFTYCAIATIVSTVATAIRTLETLIALAPPP